MKKFRPLALMCCVSSAIALQCTLPAFSQTAIPRQMSYQGVLREGETIVVDGKYSIQFALYGSSEGGMPLWTEVQTVELRGGLFNVILGQYVALPTVLPTDAWLGIAINNSLEMPRTKLTSVPFALTAGTAQALTPNATGAVLSLNGQQGALELRAADGFEVRAEKGVLTIGKSTQSKEEEILNQGTEWLLAGNTNATTSHWLGTSNDVPLIVKTNNTERLRVQSTGNGNVGIGETNPGSRLTVARTFHLTNTGGAPELKLSAASGSASTTFKTGTQLTSVTYTLPNSAPSINGQVLTSTTTGLMTWTTPAANLAHFNEGFHNAAPNAAVTVASFTPKLAVPNMDVAIVPKGTGALLADIPDGTAAGGNKRGENAVDLQSSRGVASQVASGDYSSKGGGSENRADADYSTISGGQGNTIMSDYPTVVINSTISGGYGNLIKAATSVISGGLYNSIEFGENSVIGGGSNNRAEGESSLIGGGLYNTVSGESSVIGGGSDNEIVSSGDFSVINGGSDNIIEGVYSAIIGGRGLTLTGNGSFGFLGNNRFGDNDMTVNNDNAAVFGNVDLLLLNNDGDPRELRFYASDGFYTSFHANVDQSRNISYSLPLTGGEDGQVLTTNGLGQLSWTSNGAGLQFFTESRYVFTPNTSMPVHRIQAQGSESSIDFAIMPKGDGALVMSVPDGLYTGGNKRGLGALDLQRARESATQVASGISSIISGGINNTASGDYAIVSGGINNTASGDYASVSGGLTNEALGWYANINGGSNNAVDMEYSTIGGGSGNIVQYGISGVSGYATIGGGRENSVSGDYSMIGGGFENTINDDFSIITGGRENIVNGQYSAINSGELNSVTGSYSVVNGGLENTITDAISSSVLGGSSNSINGSYSIISGGYRNQVSGHTSSIIGGRDNIISSNYSGILGGRGLTLSGNGSVGFLGNNNDGTRNMTVSAANTAVFGNVDMWLVNNDNTAHEMRLYEASGSGTNYTAFKAGAQSADIVYTLPTSAGSNGQVLTTNGSGILSWTTASGGGLTHFTESRNTSAPNATVPVHQIAATGTEINIDIALTPKGSGALTAQIADGTAAGGNKRGIYAVDLQMSRNAATQVASGDYSTIGGGVFNTASNGVSTVSGGLFNTSSGGASTVSGGQFNISSGEFSTVSGGFDNRASGIGSTVGGGQRNTASADPSTIGGGSDNSASGIASTVSGGYRNTASAQVSTVGGGADNRASGIGSTISGGEFNTASGGYSAILGGRGLTLSGNGSVGFFGNNNDGTRNMTLSAANTAVFGNVDMWLVNNDNTAHEMRLYEASSSGTNYTAFKAGAQSTNIVYTLPTSAGSNGQVLTTNGSGVLSWGIVGFQYFIENRNAIVPNTSRPVHQIVVSGDENDIDLALSPKGDGALTASVANGIPSGGNKRGAGAVDWQTRRNAAEFVASGQGSVLSGGTDNTASGMNAVVSGGQGNVAAGTNSAILGGRGLTLSGSGSVGFLGKNTGGHNMNVSAANTAVFGNVDMWLINNDSISRELRFYEKSSAGNHYTGFKAQDQAASITYTLPAGDGSSGQVLTTNGTGSLYWSSAGSGGLTHFTESVNTAAPNATIPVVRLLATNGATNVDIALSPKGMGALTADLADNTVTGGNKRGAKAVDWQMQRTSAVQIANGDHSVIGGGSDNAAIGQYAVAAGGYTNNAAGYASAIGGGAGNFGNASFATVAGGSTNTASATYASVGGGDDNTASGIYSVVSGGFNNIADGFSSSINGGNANEVHGQYSGINGGELNIINGDYSAILGGNGLTLHADRSIGYNANNEFGTRAMSVNTPNTAVFNNVDFWLTNNDNTTRSLRFYEQYNNDGAFPNSTNYIGFKAPNAIAADIVWTLPAADGTNGQVLTTNGSGQLSWASGGATLQNFTETVNTAAPNTSVPVVQFTATNASANVDIALTPKGTGSLAAHSATGSASGGNKRGANAVDWQTLRSVATEIASGTTSVIGGGGGNTASGTYSTIAGGLGNTASQGYATIGGGSANTANGAYSTVGGGVNNTVSGGSSVIPGGSGLTLSGTGSFGFLSNNAGTNAMSVSENNVAVFANTNLWLANNDANPSELRFYEANTVTSGAFPPAALNYTAFKAQPQTANIVYTLPADDGNAGQVLSTDGTGMLSWADASAGALSHFVESYHNDGNNGAVTVSRLSASTAAANVDIALSPRGVGSLLASLPDGTATGGNKRGSSAVDWQLSRNSNLQIASGNYSVISGGQYNRASSDHAAVGGGIGNNASGQVAIIAGGQNNTASSTWSTVSGGFNNSATGSSSVVVGGFGNIAAGENSTVLGGRGLNLEGSGNIGFLGNNSGGPRNMTVNTSNTAVFGNVDMWLINNDNTAHELRMYEASGDGDNYTAFKAQAQTETIVYTLPATAPPATDYVMTVQESSGNNATLGWGKRIIQVQDTPVDCDNLTGGGGNATVDITVADAVVGGTVHVSPRQAMEGGVFIAYSFIPSNGTVRIMFINATAGDIDPDSVNMDITVIQP